MGADAMAVDRLARFASFVTRAGELAPRPDASRVPDEFREFVARATPLVVARVARQLDMWGRRIEALRRVRLRHDLLDVARVTGDELAYTEMLRWLLSVETHAPSALRRQRALLGEVRRCGASFDPDLLREACEPQTNFAIAGHGIVDLVLAAPRFVLAVETKTGTEEHETPAGTPQTVSYEEGLRRSLQLTADTPIAVVLLAPERRTPENPRATAMTFLDVAGAFAEAFDDLDLDAETAWALRAVLTHLVDHATTISATRMRRGLDAAAACRLVAAASERERQVGRRLADLASVVGALEGRDS